MADDDLPPYAPPAGDLVAIDFTDAYTPPSGDSVAIEFIPGDTPVVDTQYIFPPGHDSLSFGEVKAIQTQFIRPQGFDASSFGDTLLDLSTKYILTPGFNAQIFGTATVINTSRLIRGVGFSASLYGRPTVENWIQYRNIQGFNASLYGTPFVQGGVKTVLPSGINSNAYGRPVVVNTTANRTLLPSGIAAPAVPGPSLSPRSIRHQGFNSALYGSARIYFPPRPVGWISSAFGYPTIEYKTKVLRPAGIGADDQFGFPRVFDRTSTIHVSSVQQAGIFGDTAARNANLIIRPAGLNSLEFSSWADLYSNKRELIAAGIHTPGFGLSIIENASPSAAPPGFESMAFGMAGIGYRNRTVYPPGFYRTAFGGAVFTKTPEIRPQGFAGAAGTPRVWPRIRPIETIGRDSSVFGLQVVSFANRSMVTTGTAFSSYGNAVLTHSTRGISAAGFRTDASGRPLLTFRVRSLSPRSIFDEFNSDHTVGGTRWIRPDGYVATLWGTRIIPEIQNIYTNGGLFSLYGDPAVSNKTTLVSPPSIRTNLNPVDSFGIGRVHNSRQYIRQFFDSQSGLVPPPWPQWTLIENKNKFAIASGFLAQAFGSPLVMNKATPVLPAGIPPQAIIGGMVAHRVRYLPIDGIEPPYFSGWSRVHNDARVISPGSFDAFSAGRPSLVNTRRYFDRIGGIESGALGYPMVAFAIREITFESRYSIAPPIIPLPKVDLYSRYIDGIGFDTSGYGWHSLSIHRKVITTRWTHVDLFGEPNLRNVTPEVRSRGHDSSEFGNAMARTQWRRITDSSFDASLFGNATIADKTRRITVAGHNSGVVSDKLVVTKTGAPPFSPQAIFLDALDDQSRGNGIPIPEQQVPRPIMNQHVVYVHQTQPMSLYGMALVTANTIRMVGYHENLVGRPSISLKNREILVLPSPNPAPPSAPVISPHTIWAVMDAPQQAKENHPFRPLHYVNSSEGTRSPGEVFGRPTITLRHRRVSANTVGITARYGVHTIYLRRRYVLVPGFNSLRLGWHDISDGLPRVIEPFDSHDSMVFGRPAVARGLPRGPQTVRPLGMTPPAIPLHRVEYFHREIRVNGLASLAMGSSRGDRPYQWQTLNVGPPMPTIPNGFDAQLLGMPWVSFKVRGVDPDGFDSFISEYDLEHFDLRMRVARVPVPRPFRIVSPSGFDASALGTPGVRPGAYYIRPDGNSEQYRKGGLNDG